MPKRKPPEPGEIYQADIAGKDRPIVVVSIEPLNRGDYVVIVPFTSAKYQTRRLQENCADFPLGTQPGLTKDCVAQAEQIQTIDQTTIDFDAGPAGDGVLGVLSQDDYDRVTEAIKHVIGAY